MKKNIDLEEILEKAYQKLLKEITEAYYDNKLEEVMEKYNLVEECAYSYYDKNTSRLLVIGDSNISKEIMLRIAKSIGIKEERIDFELDYDKLTNYNFGKLQNSQMYSDILVGPIPHKVKGLDDHSSFLAMVEANPEEFPKTIKLCGSNELKISKQSFKDGLIQTRLYIDLNR